ncbi:MAG: hypothetical protein OQK25_05320, partial [Gammaproteobacteria bacterium]|nr:hypothetical protein [Gammaproteobacteria bacterium]
FVALVIWSGAEFLQQAWLGWLAIAGLVVAVGLFAVILLWLQQQRKRRLPDVTLNYWRISMIAFLVSIILWLTGYLQEDSRWMESAVSIFLMGGILSAVSGMLFKIVPFLVWLHLNNLYQSEGEWQGNVPNVRQVIPAVYSLWQFRVQMVALGLVTIAPLELLLDQQSHYIAQAAGITWIGSFALMLMALLSARSKYQSALSSLSDTKSA